MGYRLSIFSMKTHRRILCVTSNFPRWSGDSTTPFVLHLGPVPTRRCTSRRRVVLTLKRATRNGDRELIVLTNLPAEQADAASVVELLSSTGR